jgi:type II secretory pathway pseudopilin PulG
VTCPRASIRKTSGFALIDVIFTCGMIGLLFSIAVPRLLLARQSAAASSAIGSMRTIASAQLAYALTCGSGFYAPSLSSLGTPPPGSNEPFIAGGLGQADTVLKSTYQIQMSATPFAGAPASCNGVAGGLGGQGFKAGADATVPPVSRFFATNANGVIFEDVASLYAAMPEVGEPAAGHVLGQ